MINRSVPAGPVGAGWAHTATEIHPSDVGVGEDGTVSEDTDYR